MTSVKSVSTSAPPVSPRRREPRSISLIIPCYNEEAVLPELCRRLEEIRRLFPYPFEAILIDDGSTDRTPELIFRCCENLSFVRGVRLSRNFGHQTALSCGLDQAQGEVVVVLDADLQDPPELIPEMIERWKAGYDVVYGTRRTREGDGRMKRFFAFAFYRILERIAGLPIPRDSGDFRLLDRRAVDALRSMGDRHRFIRGMVSWIGYPQSAFEYDRAGRFAGETKYPFRKSLFLAIDAITSFSYAPLRLASYVGVVTSCAAFVYILVVIFLKIIGVNWSGYTSLMGSILLLGGIQLTLLGILGEYVGRIFEQGQRRPLYLIERIQGEPLSTDPAP